MPMILSCVWVVPIGVALIVCTLLVCMTFGRTR